MENSTVNSYSFAATKIDPDVRASNGQYMAYGDANDYPEQMVELYNNSSLHHTLIKGIAQMISGEGVYSEDERFDYTVFTSSLDEDLEQIVSKLALELKLNGYCYLEVIKRKNKVELNSIPAQYVRNGEHKLLEMPKSFFVNPDPDKQNNFTAEIHAFDGRRNHSMLYIKTPDTVTRSYSSPDYIGGLNDILLDYKSKRHKLNSVEHGLMPLTLFKMPDEGLSNDQKRLVENRLLSKYTGSESTSRLMVHWQRGEKDIAIDSVETPNMVEFFKELTPEVTQSILFAHRVTSPALFGLYLGVSSGLGNNSEELLVAYSIFMETVIKPYQKTLLKGLVKVMELAGQPTDITIAQLNPGILSEENETDDVTETEEGAEIEEDKETIDQTTQLQGDKVSFTKRVVNKILGK